MPWFRCDVGLSRPSFLPIRSCRAELARLDFRKSSRASSALQMHSALFSGSEPPARLRGPRLALSCLLQRHAGVICAGNGTILQYLRGAGFGGEVAEHRELFHGENERTAPLGDRWVRRSLRFDGQVMHLLHQRGARRWFQLKKGASVFALGLGFKLRESPEEARLLILRVDVLQHFVDE